MNPLSELAEFAAGTRLNDIPGDVIDHSKKIIADTLAVIVRGYNEARYMQNLSSVCSGKKGRCTILGTGNKTTPSAAALINSSSGTVLELDEGHRFAGSHAAVQILPAALAACEMTEASGKELLEAFTIAYEVGTRVGYALRPFREGLHTHGTWAAVGAAIAVSLVYGKRDPSFLANCMGIASNMAHSTSWETAISGATVRNVYSGLASSAGVLSYFLAASGITSQDNAILTSLARSVSKTGRLNADPTINLGKDYFITKNYFKVFPCCGYTHSVVEAVIKLKHEIVQEEISGIEVRTFKEGAMLNSKLPRNSLAAKFSIPYIVARTILDKTLWVDSFSEQEVASKKWEKISRIVEVKLDNELERMFPEKWAARVAVTMKDGRVIESFVENPRGDWRSPFSDEELRRKFFLLTNLGTDTIQKIYSIEKIPTVADLTEIVRLNQRSRSTSL